MAPPQKGPRQEKRKDESSVKEDNKRVCKACDRCRLKKSKCDGSRPCNRCKSDDGICMYGERKKVTEKIYPKGYCDQLVADHDRLIKCIHILYEHCSDAKIKWAFPKVERESKGGYSTHNILKSMDLLQHVEIDDNDENENELAKVFQDDTKVLLKQFKKKEAIRTQRQMATKQEPSISPPVSSIPTPVHTNSAPIHAAPVQSHISMSRTPSADLAQSVEPFPALDRSHHPSAITTTNISHTPSGGYAPPTPAESPSKDESYFRFNTEGQNTSQLSTLDQPVFAMQPQSFTSAAQVPGLYMQACATIQPPNHIGNTPFPPSGGPSTYQQHFRVPHPYMPHQRGPVGAGDVLASHIRGDDLPLSQMLGIDQNQVWSSASVPTATDPMLGFDSNMELLQEFGEMDFIFE